MASIELQVISCILTSQESTVVSKLLSFDDSYYSVFRPHISFIHEHYRQNKKVPDRFTFQVKFPDFIVVEVKETLEWLTNHLIENKKQILLVETFNKIKDLGESDASDAWKYLRLRCDEAMSLNSDKPMDLVGDAQKRADTVLKFSKQARIPTGFDPIDKAMYGGLSTVEELLLLIARTNSGKAQPLWSKVLTPTGWKCMKDIKIGDIVVGENNDNGKVVNIFPQGEIDYYRITFDDNTTVECCDNHLWKVLTKLTRRSDVKKYGIHEVVTTNEIRNNLNLKYSVDISEAIEFENTFNEDTELDGYLLGVIIGDGGLRDGSVTITNENEEIWNRIEQTIIKYNCIRSTKRKTKSSIIGIDHKHNYVKDKLSEYGLMLCKSIDKFIPKQYLTAPIHVRKALLAGLLDTDGYAHKNGSAWEFDTASEQLCADFVELARSLGIKVKVHDREPSYYTKNGIRIQAHGTRNILCRSTFNPFWVSGKANKFNYRTTIENHNRIKRHCKMIKSIEYVGKTECQCIMLDNHTHTYITDGYTITHNTWVSTKIAESAQRHGFPVLYYSPEMQASYLGTRFDTWRGHFANSQIFRGQYSEEYWAYIKNLQNDNPTPLYILENKDAPNNTVDVPYIEEFVKTNGIKLVVIDGLAYMTDVRSKKGDSDYNKYKNICEDLFNMSKQYGCAVVVVVQANRATKDSKDDKGEPFPNLYNIEGSDHPARIATQAFAIRQIFEKHILDIRLEKSRNSANQKPVFSFKWDINTGDIDAIANPEDLPTASTPVVETGFNSPDLSGFTSATAEISDLELDEDVEF